VESGERKVESLEDQAEFMSKPIEKEANERIATFTTIIRRTGAK